MDTSFIVQFIFDRVKLIPMLIDKIVSGIKMNIMIQVKSFKLSKKDPKNVCFLYYKTLLL